MTSRSFRFDTAFPAYINPYNDLPTPIVGRCRYTEVIRHRDDKFHARLRIASVDGTYSGECWSDFIVGPTTADVCVKIRNWLVFPFVQCPAMNDKTFFMNTALNKTFTFAVDFYVDRVVTVDDKNRGVGYLHNQHLGEGLSPEILVRNIQREEPPIGIHSDDLAKNQFRWTRVQRGCLRPFAPRPLPIPLRHPRPRRSMGSCVINLESSFSAPVEGGSILNADGFDEDAVEVDTVMIEDRLYQSD